MPDEMNHEATKGTKMVRYEPVPVECEPVDDLVIVELKAVEQLIPLYDAQLLIYLKLAKKHLGLLINFNVPLLKHGVKRLVCTSALHS